MSYDRRRCSGCENTTTNYGLCDRCLGRETPLQEARRLAEELRDYWDKGETLPWEEEK